MISPLGPLKRGLHRKAAHRRMNLKVRRASVEALLRKLARIADLESIRNLTDFSQYINQMTHIGRL